MSQPALRCVGLTKTFNGTPAVSDLSLEVEEGEVLALLGPSGCGKTTALRMIAGFEVPDSGEVEVGGRPMAGPGVFVPPEKRRIGMVFQDYALFPHLSVEENVAYGVAVGNRLFDRAGGRRRRLRRASQVSVTLSLVELSHLRSRMPHELSGGEQQRVALARALASQPHILLLDEPFSNLDAKLRQQVREELREILGLSGVTTLFVTHYQEEALYIGDRVAALNRGRLEQVDAPEVVYRFPATTFVADFVGVADFLTADFRDGEIHTEVGRWPQAAPPGDPSDLKALARPDDVTFEPAEEGQGRVVARMYQGAYSLYRIILDSGEMVHCSKPDLETHPVGMQVRVRLKPGRRLVCYQQGRAITGPGAA